MIWIHQPVSCHDRRRPSTRAVFSRGAHRSPTPCNAMPAFWSAPGTLHGKRAAAPVEAGSAARFCAECLQRHAGFSLRACLPSMDIRKPRASGFRCCEPSAAAQAAHTPVSLISLAIAALGLGGAVGAAADDVPSPPPPPPPPLPSGDAAGAAKADAAGGSAPAVAVYGDAGQACRTCVGICCICCAACTAACASLRARTAGADMSPCSLSAFAAARRDDDAPPPMPAVTGRWLSSCLLAVRGAATAAGPLLCVWLGLPAWLLWVASIPLGGL
jgi:hypothetical protein